MSGRVTVVGSLNADLVVPVERHPLPGETVLGGDVRVSPGGKGANQAVAAARLGGRVRMVGRVGRDEHGALLRATLAAAGVDAARVLDTPAPTGVAFISVSPAGENTIVVSPGANAHLSEQDVRAAAEAFADADVVVCQLEVPLATVAEAVRSAGRAGAAVVLNAAPAAPLGAELLAGLDTLVVNEHEASVQLPEGLGPAAGEGDPLDGHLGTARRLLALGPRRVVLTAGSLGAVAVERSGDTASRAFRVPAPRVPAVDTTGAGDTFVGALAAALAAGADLDQGLRLAVDAAALAVTRHGAIPSIPTLQEVRHS